MRKPFFMCIVLFGIFGFISAEAQVEKLEGTWKLTTFVEGSQFSEFIISPDAIATCTETLQHVVNKNPYSFRVLEKGKVQVNDASMFLYAGGGTASATEEKSIRVITAIIASGVISPASNIIAGIWSGNQVYSDKISTAEIYYATPAPFLLVQNGIAPVLPGKIVQDIAGDWDFAMTGGNFGLTWNGMVTLNTSGAIIGFLFDSGIIKGREFPGGGYFTISPDGTFSFKFTTFATIPKIGDKEVTISGSGKIQDNNTQISGTITLSVADMPISEPATKTNHASHTSFIESYSAEFTMNKKPEKTTEPTVDLSLTMVSSTFDNDRDGWMVIGDAQDETFIPDYKSVNGNPGGYLEAHDDVYGGTWYWFAPPKYLGNKEKAYNGILTFDLKESDLTPAFDEYDVVLESSEGPRLYYKFDNYPGKSWTNYIVPLRENGWKVDGTFRPATETEMRLVLRALSALWVRGEYLEGDDNGGLDNVYMLSASVTPLDNWLLY